MTKDLEDFFRAAMRGMGLREPKHIIVVAAPARSRGCAEVGPMERGRREGEKVVIAIASPAHFSLPRLARLTKHEFTHSLGLEHEAMGYNTQYSLGPIDDWAKPFQRPNWPRYVGRAPNQL